MVSHPCIQDNEHHLGESYPLVRQSQSCIAWPKMGVPPNLASYNVGPPFTIAKLVHNYNNYGLLYL